jgi:hypothetical protein
MMRTEERSSVELQRSKLSRLNEFCPRSVLPASSEQVLEDGSYPMDDAPASHRQGRRKRHSSSSTKVLELERVIEQLKSRTVQLEWLSKHSEPAQEKDADVTDLVQRMQSRLDGLEISISGLLAKGKASQPRRLSLPRGSVDDPPPRRRASLTEILSPVDDENVAFEWPQSLATFCVEQAMAPLLPTLDGVVALLQMVAVSTFQGVLVFGFFDTLWLKVTQDSPQYSAGPILPAEFYSMQMRSAGTVPDGLDRTYRFNCEAGTTAASCVWLPRINVLASYAALVLFACGPLMLDDQQSLVTMQPIDYLLFDERVGEFYRSQPRWRTALMLLWRLATALVLQVCWAARALFLPAFAMIGTVFALLDAETAFDVCTQSLEPRTSRSDADLWSSPYVGRLF